MSFPSLKGYFIDDPATDLTAWLPLKGGCMVRRDLDSLKEWEEIYASREQYDLAAMCRDYIKEYFGT